IPDAAAVTIPIFPFRRITSSSWRIRILPGNGVAVHVLSTSAQAPRWSEPGRRARMPGRTERRVSPETPKAPRRTPMDTTTTTSRRFLGAASALAGATTLAPAIARAQGALGEPRSVITNPPRDYSPGAPPVTYVDPDVITVDSAFNGLRQGNTPILRLW